jgi:glycosyltransferase involved in cell wall biosynthesis
MTPAGRRRARTPRPVGLNALFMEPRQIGGTEVYVRQLVAALGREAPSRTFLLYVAREAAATDWDLPDNVRLVVAPVRSTSRVQRLGWELSGLVAVARRHRVELLHSLGTTSPLWAPMAKVVTVHDLIFEAFPEAFPGARAAVLRRILPLMLRRADRIVADSRATADDVAARYGIADTRIDVVPLGPGRPPLEMSDERASAMRASLGIESGYILSVATTQPHKNLDGLIEAMRILGTDRPAQRLVLVGAAGTADAGLRRRVAEAGLDRSILFGGRVNDETLDALYRGAALFVYPSLYEGFGFPLLEAMQRGVAVLSSEATSLPEVGGDAVAYVDARSPAAIASEIGRLLDDPERRARLVSAGRARVDEFSWRRAAKETLAVYERLT